MTSFGEDMFPKLFKSGQFQSEMPKYKNFTISKTANPSKPTFEDKAETTTYTSWVATIILNQIQHGQWPPS